MLSDASDRDQSLLRCHVWVDKLFEEWRSMKATSAKMMEREHKRKSETGKMDILKANTRHQLKQGLPVWALISVAFALIEWY